MVRKGQYNYADFDQAGRLGPSEKLLNMLLDHPNSGCTILTCSESHRQIRISFRSSHF